MSEGKPAEGSSERVRAASDFQNPLQTLQVKHSITS